jgi:hypothetical protein
MAECVPSRASPDEGLGARRIIWFSDIGISPGSMQDARKGGPCSATWPESPFDPCPERADPLTSATRGSDSASSIAPRLVVLHHRGDLRDSAGHVWGCSSVGRAPRWHRGGRRFEPVQLHLEVQKDLVESMQAAFCWGHQTRRGVAMTS